jgi:CBS domain-containing protein
MKAIRVAQSPAPTIAAEAFVQEALERLETRCGCALAVVDGTRFVGTLSKDDVMRKVTAEGKDAGAIRVAEVMNKSPISVTLDTDTNEALQTMFRNNQCYLPILTAEGEVRAWLAICQLFEDHVDALTRQLYSLEHFIANDAPGG